MGPRGERLHPELQNRLRQLDEAREAATRLATGLTAEQIGWRAAPGRWSIAECLAHLSASTAAYLPAIDCAIRFGRERGFEGPGPYRHGFFMNWFVRSMEPPPRRRLRAPKVFQPELPDPVTEVLRDFLAFQDDLERRVRAADGLDLGRVKLSSPAARWMRMTLGQCFALLVTHQRRHLWQAARVRDDDQFPRPAEPRRLEPGRA